MSAASWDRLPPELRYNIICYLPKSGTKWANLSSVSREWQSVLEPLNFSRINLSVPRLDDPVSQAILFKRRKEIRYIWFRIELAEYDCTRCTADDPELWALSMTDNEHIKGAFDRLFAALCKWEACNDLILDISIYSLRDNQHYSKHLTFCSDSTFELDGCSGIPRNAQERSVIKDPAHGWVPGQQVDAPGELAIDQTFGEIMGEGPFEDEEPEMEWWDSLPVAPAVKGVLLRQQTRRRWKPVALSHMLSRFPNLHQLLYEPWREFDGMDLHTNKRSEFFINSLCSTDLQKFVFFANNNKAYAKKYAQCSLLQIPHARVSHAVARLSMQLAYLAASFIVDASYFFEACEKLDEWEKLKSLALTSKAFTDQINVLEVNKMLRNAATTVLKMPALETLELWNGSPGHAMLFRYQRDRDGRSSTVTIRGTSHFELDDTTRQAWSLVAETQYGGNLSFQKSYVEPSLIRCHGDAICQLGLLIEVVRPVSLQQILAEHILTTPGCV